MTGFVTNCENESTTLPKRKLVLHFDQHNTIQVACTLPGRRITVEEGLNNFLTSAVWGKEIDDKWVWISQEPQIHKPENEPDAQTYFKYLEKKIVKSPNDRAELKKKTCNFVYEPPGSVYREFFDLYLKSLTYQSNWDYKKALETSEDSLEDKNVNYYNESIAKIKLPCNTIPAGDPSNISLYHLILPEFFDMIQRLQKENREFSIILRTMGIDSQNFLDTIRPVLEGKHPHFKSIKPIHINPNIGSIKRYSNDRIELEIDGQVFTDEDSIYEKLNSLQGINAIRDDFAFWQMNNYECYSAKPLWINLNDSKNQHIIFDDNIRLDSFDDCIVNLRLNNTEPSVYVNLDFDSYRIFEKSSILQPNLIQLLNPHLRIDSTKNHYLEKIKKAERIYDKILENKFNIKYQTRLSTDEMDLSTNSLIKLAQIEMSQASSDAINALAMSPTSANLSSLEQVQIIDFKKKKNLKLNRSFSLQIKEEEKHIERANQKLSTICLIQ